MGRFGTGGRPAGEIDEVGGGYLGGNQFGGEIVPAAAAVEDFDSSRAHLPGTGPPSTSRSRLRKLPLNGASEVPPFTQRKIGRPVRRRRSPAFSEKPGF